MVMRRLLPSVLGACALVFSACAPAAQPAPTSAPAGGAAKPAATTAPAAGKPAASGQMVSWKHGIVVAKADASYLLMAREKGFFQQQGINVEYMEFQSDATMAQALVAGELDSMEASPAATIAAIDRGSDLKIIGATMPGMPYAIYSKKDIATIEDLKGKTIGISAPGALPEVITKAILLSKNVDPNSVTFSNAGGDAQRFTALKGGKVDAVAAATEFKDETEKDPNIKILALASDYVPEYLRFMIIANGNTLKTKTEAVPSFLAAHMQGLRYALNNREEALALCAKTTNVEATNPRCAETYDLIKQQKYVDPNMQFDPARLTWLQNLRIKLGQQKDVLPNERLLDLSFRDKALEKIGKV